MPRRKPWNDRVPDTAADARRTLLDAARRVIERVGLSKAGLSDVAEEAGVTRQTVYRYFDSAEDLFHSAAAFSTGGFHQRLRARALERPTLADRLVESMVFAIVEIPRDPHLEGLIRSGDYFRVATALQLGFVQEEIAVLGGHDGVLDDADREMLAELLLRLLHSFLFDPSPTRGEEELRALLLDQVGPVVDSKVKKGTRPPRQGRTSTR